MFGFLRKKHGKKAEDKTEIMQIPLKTAEDTAETEEAEIIAVITAAVASVLDKPLSGFRVVSFKKRSEWKHV